MGNDLEKVGKNMYKFAIKNESCNDKTVAYLYYDEFPLLLNNQGRSCQDDCYLLQLS